MTRHTVKRFRISDQAAASPKDVHRFVTSAHGIDASQFGESDRCSGMTPKVIARDPHFPRGRFTLAESSDPAKRRRLSFRDTVPFATNEKLSGYIDSIMKHSANRALGARVREMARELSDARKTPLLTIDEISFASDFRSPWHKNNRVYAYLYRRSSVQTGKRLQWIVMDFL